MPRSRVNVRSLRSRWHGPFAGLFAVVVLGGVANLAGTRALVGTFRTTAERVEQATSLLAQLRTDIVPHALLQVSTADVDGSQRRALGAAMGTPEQPSPVQERGAAIAVGVPEVLEILEQAGGTARAPGPGRRGMGVQVALDDFGTGYASIEYLRQLPIDILKIDRSFISGDRANQPGDVLLEALVGLAQRLGPDVIPEGIEQPDELARVRALGCRTGQGFLLARPQPAVAIDDLLAAPLSLLPFVPADTDRRATLL